MRARRSLGPRTGRILLALVGLIAAATVAACGSSSGSSGSSAATQSQTSAGNGSANQTTIRLAMPQDSPPINIPVWVAEQQGFFTKRGLNVQADTPNIPFSSQLATLGHQYDLVISSQPDLIHAVASGIHDVAVFGAELDVPQDPAAGLVMSASSGVTSIRQMAGKSVGAPSLTGNNWTAFECWLDKNGVNPTSVRGVTVAPPELPDLIKANRVEGALIFNPFLTNLVSAGNKLIGDPYQGCFGTGEQNGYFTATQSWASQNKVALAKFLAAQKEAVRYIAAHKAAAQAVYVKRSGLPPAIAKQAVIYPPEMNYKISAADFANWEKIMKQVGQLHGTAPNPASLVMTLPAAG